MSSVEPPVEAPQETDVATEAPEVPPAAVPEEAAPAPADDAYRAILDALATELGDGLVDSATQRGDLWVRVTPAVWKRTAEVLRHHLDFDYFCFLSGIDWMPHTWPNPKVEAEDGEGGDEEGGDAEAEAEAEPEPAASTDGYETGIAGGDARFQALARVYSTARHLGIFVKADLDEATPQLETWSQVYAGADWHERETWEMYGFDFVGHPNLVHLYLPSAFEGFPLRKDFPLLSREVKPWPGLVDVEGFPAGYSEGGEEGEGS